jgi:8-oxo-dGTP diphosphatase
MELPPDRWHKIVITKAMRIKSFVLIEKDDRYLLIKEAAPKWEEKWFLPGGNVKDGESPEEGAIRETLEEAGCRVALNGIIYIRYYPSFFEDKVHIFYSATVLSDDLKTTEDKHSLSVKWFSYNELSKLPLRQKMLEIVDCYRQPKGMIPTEAFKIIS